MEEAKLARVRKWVILFFCLVAASMMWPIYPIFSRIEPMLLGIPFSLFYIIVLLLFSFLVLLTLYLIEERSGGPE